MTRPLAVVGVDDHCGWATFLTVSMKRGEAAVVDRRRVELIEGGIPQYPYHHEGLELPPDEAQAPVDRVKASVAACTRTGLERLCDDLTAYRVAAISIRDEGRIPISLHPRRGARYH